MQKESTKLREQLDAIDHPNISIKKYAADFRLKDMERFDIFYPLTKSMFVLFELKIDNGIFIFKQSSDFLFMYNYIFISASLGLDIYSRSDGAADATGSHCKLLYEKSGVQSFESFYDEVYETHHILMKLADGNVYRSIGYKSDIAIPAELITALNTALHVNKWE